MRTFFLLTAILNGGLAMAQGPSFNNVQRTTWGVGIAAGQTARLTILYPTVPAPLLQVLCSATLTIADDQRKNLKSITVPQISGGNSVSLDLNADTDLAGMARTQIHGISIAANGCRLITTLEIIDNITQKTVVVVGSDQTYPITALRALVTPAQLDTTTR